MDIRYRKYRRPSNGIYYLEDVVTRKQESLRTKDARVADQLLAARNHAVQPQLLNPERRLYYQLLWETGGSQSDIAELTAENIDEIEHLITYSRKKLRKSSTPCCLRMGAQLRGLLVQFPKKACLFPSIAHIDARFRSAEFSRRCGLLGIEGVSLHSYRYSWAERAKKAGMPERYAMEMLGHASKAVHRAYSCGGVVKAPSLEEYEEAAANNVVPMKAPEAYAAIVPDSAGFQNQIVGLLVALLQQQHDPEAMMQRITSSLAGTKQAVA